MKRISGELLMDAITKVPEVARAVIGGRVDPKILQALIDGDELRVVKILTLSALAVREEPTQGHFNELVNEVPVWKLLEQIDGLDSNQSEKLNSFLIELWSDEERKSDVGCYPEGFQIRTPKEQLEIWMQYFPDLDGSHVLTLADQSLLSTEAESWAVIPKFLKVKNGDYYEALDRMLILLAEQCKFKNWREEALTPEHLQIVRRTMLAHNELNKLPGDFWVFPFQFGKRWAGKSVRRGRILYDESEFGLGPYESAALLVSHPNRITGLGQLYIDCSGCIYSPTASGQFVYCLGFDWDSDYDHLHLNYYSVDDVDSVFGSLSGFRPSRP